MPDDAERDTLESLLMEGNAWARNAAVLAYLFAKRRFDHNDKENRVALFDCGSAWMSLALQARELGLYAHGMGGIHVDRTYEALGVPEDRYQAICGIAIGRYGDLEKVPEDQRVTPNGRRPIESFAFRGRFQE
jgi:nitroreductase